MSPFSGLQKSLAKKVATFCIATRTETKGRCEMSDSHIKKMAEGIESKWGLRANEKRNLWVVTLLNPQQHNVPAGLTPKECVDWALKHWCLNKSGELRKNRGALVAYEIAPATGTPHLQMLMCATNTGCTAETVLNSWPAADIEVAQSFDEAVDYIYKRGKAADKADTQIVPARAMGDDLVPNPQRSRPTSKEKLSRDEKRERLRHAVFDDRLSEDEIMSDPILSATAAGMDFVFQRWLDERSYEISAHRDEVQGLWLYGQSTDGQLVPDGGCLLDAARLALDDRFGREWGEWQLGASIQLDIPRESRAVLVSVPDGVDPQILGADLKTLMSVAPVHVHSSYRTSFYAQWELVLLVASNLTFQVMPGEVRQYVSPRLTVAPMQSGISTSYTFEQVAQQLDKLTNFSSGGDTQ